MTTLVDQWEAAHDRRAIFLGCYRLMTRNMLDAIEAGRFHDDVWVSNLLHRFCRLLLSALDLYEQASQATPPVWKLAFDATRDEDVRRCSICCWASTRTSISIWFLALRSTRSRNGPTLRPEQRAQRHADHELVNRIIGETVDAVQDQVIDRHAPWFKVSI